MPSKTALLANATRGPNNKGAVLVCGALCFEEEALLIRQRCRDVTFFETGRARRPSVIDGMETCAIPREFMGCKLQLDDNSWYEPEPPTVLVLFRGMPLPEIELPRGATIVGQEALVREALKGRRFYPRARWRDHAQVELA